MPEIGGSIPPSRTMAKETQMSFRAATRPVSVIEYSFVVPLVFDRTELMSPLFPRLRSLLSTVVNAA